MLPLGIIKCEMGRKPVVLNKEHFEFINHYLKSSKKNQDISKDFQSKFNLQISSKTLIEKFKSKDINTYTEIKKKLGNRKKTIKKKKFYILNRSRLLAHKRNKKTIVNKTKLQYETVKVYNTSKRQKQGKMKNIVYKYKTIFKAIKKKYSASSTNSN